MGNFCNPPFGERTTNTRTLTFINRKDRMDKADLHNHLSDTNCMDRHTSNQGSYRDQWGFEREYINVGNIDVPSVYYKKELASIKDTFKIEYRHLLSISGKDLEPDYFDLLYNRTAADRKSVV